MRKAVYPGTFDPITYGHIDLIKRAVKIFDEVVICVANRQEKRPLFSLEERLAMLQSALSGITNIKIDVLDGLVVDYLKDNQINVIIRGLRMVSDFEYEFQMALTNRKLNSEIETLFMMPKDSYSYLSSRLIKEVAYLGADIKDFVPPFIERQLKEKLQCKGF